MRDKRQEIKDWLQSELNRAGHGAKGKLAEYLGIRPEGVSRILTDKPGKEIREIGADELLKMSEFFGAPPPGLNDNLKPTQAPKETVKVIGKVAANSWIDVDDMDFGFEDEEPIPASPDYPASMQFALLVEGACLNKIAPHGARLDCLDIIKAEYDPVPGDLVIVERKRYGGQMVERTAKRLRQTAKGFELWPESYDPAHQEPIALYDSPEGVEIQIIGKVLWIVSKP